MKLGSIIILVGALFSLFTITYGSDGFATSCPRHMDFRGQCQNSRLCGVDFNGALGASAMVQQCACKDVSKNRHRCTCCVRCEIGIDEKTAIPSRHSRHSGDYIPKCHK
ncbi:SCR-like protein [Medicago truncatula]|uniref:SCR-like protein n=1 Tax=Medicago truncatula TaxID=3880 RepID=A0A072TX70_MEDTR|nr:SCR-like protein [Medicago truncatula]KEH21779.1 SCR-like protein [Medicago truncatula]